MADRNRSTDKGLSSAALIAVALFALFVIVFVFSTPFLSRDKVPLPERRDDAAPEMPSAPPAGSPAQPKQP